MSWLTYGFVHPERVELPSGHHMRPIREADVEIDYPAVMGSRERLWAKYGEAWGWPPARVRLYRPARRELTGGLRGCRVLVGGGRRGGRFARARA